MFTENERKEKAIEYLERLNIYRPYINAFNNKGEITMFENYGGFYVYLNDNVKLIQIIENLRSIGRFPYAIIHTHTKFGELYDFLLAPDTIWNVDMYLEPIIGQKNTFRARSYCYNATHPEFSELGDIVVKSAFDGIRRVE